MSKIGAWENIDKCHTILCGGREEWGAAQCCFKNVYMLNVQNLVLTKKIKGWLWGASY